MLKRITSMLVAICLLLTALPLQLPVYAADEELDTTRAHLKLIYLKQTTSDGTTRLEKWGEGDTIDSTLIQANGTVGRDGTEGLKEGDSFWVGIEISALDNISDYESLYAMTTSVVFDTEYFYPLYMDTIGTDNGGSGNGAYVIDWNYLFMPTSVDASYAPGLATGEDNKYLKALLPEMTNVTGQGTSSARTALDPYNPNVSYNIQENSAYELSSVTTASDLAVDDGTGNKTVPESVTGFKVVYTKTDAMATGVFQQTEGVLAVARFKVKAVPPNGAEAIGFDFGGDRTTFAYRNVEGAGGASKSVEYGGTSTSINEADKYEYYIQTVNEVDPFPIKLSAATHDIPIGVDTTNNQGAVEVYKTSDMGTKLDPGANGYTLTEGESYTVKAVPNTITGGSTYDYQLKAWSYLDTALGTDKPSWVTDNGDGTLTINIPTGTTVDAGESITASFEKAPKELEVGLGTNDQGTLKVFKGTHTALPGDNTDLVANNGTDNKYNLTPGDAYTLFLEPTSPFNTVGKWATTSADTTLQGVITTANSGSPKSSYVNFTMTADATKITVDMLRSGGVAVVTEPSGYGTASADKTTDVVEGEEVTITASATEPGYKLGTITAAKTGEEATTVTVDNNKFTMPAYDVTVTVTFVPDGKTPITPSASSPVYNKNQNEPTISFGGVTLNKGTDYTVAYKKGGADINASQVVDAATDYVAEITLIGTAADNYRLTANTANFSITPAPVTFTTSFTKTYNGNPNAETDSGVAFATTDLTPNGVYGGDSVNIAQMEGAAFDGKDANGAGNRKITFTALTVDNPNYKVDTKEATGATINRRQVTLSGVDITKTYGTTCSIGEGNFTINNIVSGEETAFKTAFGDLNVTSGGTSVTATVGNYDMSIDAPDGIGNYTVVWDNPADVPQVIVEEASLNVEFTSANLFYADKTLQAKDAALDSLLGSVVIKGYDNTGFSNGDYTITVKNIKKGGSDVNEVKDAGEYTFDIVVAPITAGNYKETTINASATVSPAVPSLVYVADSLTTKTYEVDDTLSYAGAKFQIVYNADKANYKYNGAEIEAGVTADLTESSALNGVTAILTHNGETFDFSYNVPDDATGNTKTDADITGSTQTITVNPKNVIVVDASIGDTSVRYNGLSKKPTVSFTQGGEAINLTPGTDYEVEYINTTTNQADPDPTNAGEYKVKITLKGDYTFDGGSTTKEITLTINKFKVKYSGDKNFVKDYDGDSDVEDTITLVTAESDGTAMPASVTLSDISAKYVDGSDQPDANVGANKKVLISATWSDSTNYELDSSVSYTGEIRRVTVTLTFKGAVKTYGTEHTFAATDFDAAGFKGDDELADFDLGASGLNITSGGTAKKANVDEVTGYPIAIGTADVGNYHFEMAADQTLKVQPLAVNIDGAKLTPPSVRVGSTGDDLKKEKTETLTGEMTGNALVEGDTVTITYTANYPEGVTEGTTPTVTLNPVNYSSTNYTFTIVGDVKGSVTNKDANTNELSASATNPTSPSSEGGQGTITITGVPEAWVEYSTDNFANKERVQLSTEGTATVNASAGTYTLRYEETATTEAGADEEPVVTIYPAYKVTYSAGSYTDVTAPTAGLFVATPDNSLDLSGVTFTGKADNMSVASWKTTSGNASGNTLSGVTEDVTVTALWSLTVPVEVRKTHEDATVSASPEEVTFTENADGTITTTDKVTVTASANADVNSAFAVWSVVTADSISGTIANSTELVAEFTPDSLAALDVDAKIVLEAAYGTIESEVTLNVDTTLATAATASMTVDGTAISSGDTVAAGKDIILTVAPGSPIYKPTVMVGANEITAENDGTYKISMPADAITIDVTFVKAGGDIYADAPAANGSFTYTVDDNDPATDDAPVTDYSTTSDVPEGRKVTIATSPASGYQVDKITVTKADDANVTVTVTNGTFQMPAHDVKITVSFKERSSVGGGGVSTVTYTVTYDAGENGKLAEGAKNTEKVARGRTPEAVPQVVANEGFKFIGWTMDGTSVVDPKKVEISKDVTFTALYEEVKAPDVPKIEKTYSKPYAVGYEDSSFRPENKLTRGELAALIARLINKGEIPDGVYDASFPDVPEDAWYNKYIGYLEDKNVLSGYPDGSFKALNEITRGEFTSVLVRAQNFTIIPYTGNFSDVTDKDWEKDYVQTLFDTGIIAGYPDGTFGLDAPLTRAESVTMINRVLDPATPVIIFTPNDIAGHWAEDSILLAVNEREIQQALDETEPEAADDAAASEGTDEADAVADASKEEEEAEESEGETAEEGSEE